MKEFWPIYLSLHKKPGTKLLHAFGLCLGYLCAALAVLSGRYWYALAGPMVAYFFAFSAHFWVEGNSPATFKAPLLSLACDHLMTWRIIKGELNEP